MTELSLNIKTLESLLKTKDEESSDDDEVSFFSNLVELF